MPLEEVATGATAIRSIIRRASEKRAEFERAPRITAMTSRLEVDTQVATQ
jgi:hypothetical protein